MQYTKRNIIYFWVLIVFKGLWKGPSKKYVTPILVFLPVVETFLTACGRDFKSAVPACKESEYSKHFERYVAGDHQL